MEQILGRIELLDPVRFGRANELKLFGNSGRNKPNFVTFPREPQTMTRCHVITVFTLTTMATATTILNHGWVWTFPYIWMNKLSWCWNSNFSWWTLGTQEIKRVQSKVRTMTWASLKLEWRQWRHSMNGELNLIFWTEPQILVSILDLNLNWTQTSYLPVKALNLVHILSAITHVEILNHIDALKRV